MRARRYPFNMTQHRFRGKNVKVRPLRPQSSQRWCLPSVSPVKRRQVAVSESEFDGVESHSLFDSPSNRTCGLNVNYVLCVQSESLVTLVQEY